MAISVLAYMVVVLFISFFIKWPYLPVDPSTIAGSLYYICDSELFADLSRFGALESDRQRDPGGTRRITLGEMVGVSGVRRIGVDYVKHRAET